MWQKTGCLITADGSEDGLIKPEGLKSYVVTPPAFLTPTVGLSQVEELPVTAGDPTEDTLSTGTQPTSGLHTRQSSSLKIVLKIEIIRTILSVGM